MERKVNDVDYAALVMTQRAKEFLEALGNYGEIHSEAYLKWILIGMLMVLERVDLSAAETFKEQILAAIEAGRREAGE